MTLSFLGIQMLQFGIQLWECNAIFIVYYVSSQVVQDIQHQTVSVNVCVYCLFPVVVVVCCVSVVCKCLSWSANASSFCSVVVCDPSPRIYFLSSAF